MDYQDLCSREFKRRFNVSIDSANKMRKRKFSVQMMTSGAIWFKKPTESGVGVMSMYLLMSSTVFMKSLTRYLKMPSTNILGVNVQVVKTDNSALLTYTFETWSAFHEMLCRLPKEMPGWGVTWIFMDGSSFGVSEEFLEIIHYDNGIYTSITGFDDFSRLHQREVRKALRSFA
jgi:hypothetical protein